MPKLWGTELRVRPVLYFVWVRSQWVVVKFHSLHHDFATLGLKADINSKVVLESLGHSSVTITLGTYSHVLPNMQDELAIAVENLLKRS